MTVNWDKKGASKVYLWVYDYSTHKNIFNEYSTDTSKNVTVHTKGHKLLIVLYSYDRNGKNLGLEYIYVYEKNNYLLYCSFL